MIMEFEPVKTHASFFIGRKYDDLLSASTIVSGTVWLFTMILPIIIVAMLYMLYTKNSANHNALCAAAGVIITGLWGNLVYQPYIMPNKCVTISHNNFQILVAHICRKHKISKEIAYQLPLIQHIEYILNTVNNKIYDLTAVYLEYIDYSNPTIHWGLLLVSVVVACIVAYFYYVMSAPVVAGPAVALAAPASEVVNKPPVSYVVYTLLVLYTLLGASEIIKRDVFRDYLQKPN